MNTTPDAEEDNTGKNRLARVVVAYVGVAVLIPLVLFPFVSARAMATIFLILAVPPLYLFGEWFGGKYAEAWGEHHPVLKFLKAAALVIGALIVLCVTAIVRSM